MTQQVNNKGRRGLDWRAVLLPPLAVVIALLVGVLFILYIGKSPAQAYQALWTASFGNFYNFGEFLVSSTPLIFTGLSVAFAFRAGLFNIGGEGQYLMAQVAAAWVGYHFVGLPGVLHSWLGLLAAALAGAAWAAIPGLLKAYRGVHEVINTIMLNYIALFLTNWLVLGPLRAPGETPATPKVVDNAMLGHLLSVSRLNTGFLWALGAAIVIYLLLGRTTLGYEIRAVGHSPLAAEYGGISVAKNTVLAMAIAGALAGLAGGVQTLGLAGRFYQTLGFAGYGFDGIAVALLGRNHPGGVIIAAMLFGWLERGSPAMQAAAGVPKSMVLIVQAAVVLFVAAPGMLRWMLGKRREVKA